MDLAVNREIRYGIDFDDFQNPKVGDRLYVTPGGSPTGVVSARWEWRGNHWIDIPLIDSSPNVVISKDLPVFLEEGKSLGKYVNGDTIQSQGMTIEEFFEDLVTEVVAPTYVPPTATLTSNYTKKEVGEVINITFSSTFIKNDGGNSSAFSLKKNGSQISTSPSYTDVNVSIPLESTPIEYQGTYTYAQGPIKNDNMGNPHPLGRIPAGTVNTNKIIVFGLYKFFFGATEETSAASIIVRDGLSQFEDENSLKVILNTNDEFKNFFIWVPNKYEIDSVIDLDAMNVNITSEYIEHSKTINNGGGGIIAGRLYVMNQDTPYKSSHRHQITLKLA